MTKIKYHETNGLIMETLNQIFKTGKEKLDELNLLQWCDATAGNGDTFFDNENVFKEIKIIYKTFHDRFIPNLKTNILGFESEFPIYPAPVAGLTKVHPKGEEILVKVCSALGIPTIFNDKINSDIKNLVSISKTPVIWVLKPFTDLKIMEETIKRGIDNGISGFGINVDVIYGMQSNNKIIELKDKTPNDLFYYEKIRQMTSKPILIKGIMHIDDVKKAEKIGYDAVVLSNHGGRVLDSVVSPLRNIEEIKSNTNIDLFVDGGFRNGLDIYKGLALGAKGVLIGRPIHYALAGGGENYLYNMFTLMKEELIRALGLTNHRNIENIDKSTIRF